MKAFLVFVFFILLCHVSFAQKKVNPRIERPASISFYGLGAPYLGSVTYDNFFTPNWQLSLGAGVGVVHGGMNFHLLGKTSVKWTPYLGLAVMYSYTNLIGVDALPYGCLGIQYTALNHFNFALELAPQQIFLLAVNVAGIKIGYRF